VTGHTHTWTRTDEHETAPTNGRQWNARFVYSRTVSRCGCGAVSRSGIRRMSRASVRCSPTLSPMCPLHGARP